MILFTCLSASVIEGSRRFDSHGGDSSIADLGTRISTSTSFGQFFRLGRLASEITASHHFFGCRLASETSGDQDLFGGGRLPPLFTKYQQELVEEKNTKWPIDWIRTSAAYVSIQDQIEFYLKLWLGYFFFFELFQSFAYRSNIFDLFSTRSSWWLTSRLLLCPLIVGDTHRNLALNIYQIYRL